MSNHSLSSISRIFAMSVLMRDPLWPMPPNTFMPFPTLVPPSPCTITNASIRQSWNSRSTSRTVCWSQSLNLGNAPFLRRQNESCKTPPKPPLRISKFAYPFGPQFLADIERVCSKWNRASFDGTYADAKHQSEEFTTYKRIEKRRFVAEKTELESLLGNIQTKVKTYGLRMYTPPAGLQLSDLDTAWRSLTKAEAQRSKTINAKIGAYI